MSRFIDLDELNKFPIRLSNYDEENGNENFVFGAECVLEYANELPKYTSDLIPAKTGYWIKSDKIKNCWKCSCCLHYNSLLRSPFCSMCGAKMSGGNENA